MTNMELTHATPASMYAHTTNRKWAYDTYEKFPAECRGKIDDIAKQLIYNDVGEKINVIFGGGRKVFKTKDNGGLRSDEDLIQAWKEKQKQKNKNYDYIENKEDLENLDENTDHVFGLFAEKHLEFVLKRNNSLEPSLDMMVEKAIGLLKNNQNGFFLMVEGGRIDKGHHYNMAKHALEETLELEKAVQIARELTKEEEDETLIVVTADHSHAMTINGYPQRGNDILGKFC